MNQTLNLKRFSAQYLPICLLLIIAFILRIYKLDYQSLWLDEIHTARQSDMSLSELFAYLYKYDSHPPLFYLIEKLMTILFGSSEISLRILPAVAGTVSVWAIYLLGKEFYNKNLGLTAAALTCFNYYNLYYSQEARQYIFLFLLVCFSFLYLIRFIKTLKLKNGLMYALFTLLTLYFQYFGLFVLIAQCILIAFFWLLEQQGKKKFFINMLICFLIIALGFSFRIPHIQKMSTVGSSWIQPTPDNFATNIFFEFFGNSGLLQPFIILFLLLGIIYLFYNLKKSNEVFKKNQYNVLSIVLFCWICFTLLIPYLRSIMVIPMIVSRYFITILPAFILILALGFEFIKNTNIKYTMLIFFCLLSLIDITLVKKYYSTVTKTQFRELAQQITDYPTYPANFVVTDWQQEYYLQKGHFKGAISKLSYADFSDKVLADSSYHGFWLADAHGGAKPGKDVLDKLSTKYNLIDSIDFYDAWGILFLNKSGNGTKYNLYNYRVFGTATPFINNTDTLMPIWGNNVISASINLPPGDYDIFITASGTKSKNIFPHLNLMVDNEKIGHFFTNEHLKKYSFKFRQMKQSNSINLQMDNDYIDPETKEDRNAFVKSILVLKE